MQVEWDAKKAADNLRKHGVSFDEAASALLDPNALAQEDRDAAQEQRWALVGMSAAGRVLTVVYALRGEDRIRLISARKSTRAEVSQYA